MGIETSAGGQTLEHFLQHPPRGNKKQFMDAVETIQLSPAQTRGHFAHRGFFQARRHNPKRVHVRQQSPLTSVFPKCTRHALQALIAELLIVAFSPQLGTFSPTCFVSNLPLPV